MTMRKTETLSGKKTTAALARPGPVGGKRDENRKQRRAEFEQAALELFLRQGIEGTTIDDIVERTGAAKGSFYRYYEDKKDMVNALLEPMRQALFGVFDRIESAIDAARTPAELMETYQLLALSISGVIFSNPKLTLLYLQESRAPGVGARQPVVDLAENMKKAALRLTLSAHNHQLLRAVNPRVTSLAVLGASEQLLFELFKDASLGEPLQIAEALISTVLDGLRPV
jgi:AcrR family transcriptional regulator